MTDFSVFSRVFDLGIQGDVTAIWCSNQLSNLSNVLYNSNVLFAAFSNMPTTTGGSNASCALWSFETTDPLASGNTGTLPRFVYNSNSDKTFYVDCSGTSVPLSGFNSNAPIEPNTTAIIAFKTATELNAITDPIVGDSYIVTTGDPSRQSDIATWDGLAWSYYSPLSGEFATVTTTSGSFVAGTYRYNIATDTWLFVSAPSIVDTSDLGNATAPVVVGNCALTSQDDALYSKVGGPVVIVGDTLIAWGDGNMQNTGDLTAANSVPRALSWDWASLLTGSNAKSASYAPAFVDAAISATYVLALDSKGKVWATGQQLVGTGLARTMPDGTTKAVDLLPYYGLAPIPFFHSSANSNVIIRKLYVANYQQVGGNANSAALSQTGDLFVTGVNNYGNLGLGNTTAQPGWVKYSVSNVKDVKISQINMFVLTNDNKLYMSGYDAYSIGGTSANKTTPLFLASNIASFEFGHYQGVSLYAVKTDGTLWTAGLNGNGQLGLNTTTTQVGLVQVPGVTNASYVVANKNDGHCACLVRRDGVISFAGFDQYGEFGYAPHTTATTQKTFVTPSGAFQGTVSKVAIGAQTTVLMTTSGAVYNAGQTQWRGLGVTDNSWANRLFTQVPLPEAAVGFRLYTESTTNYDGVHVMTTKGRVYAYGTLTSGRWIAQMSYVYSPTLVPLRYFDYGLAVASPPPDLTQLTASLTTASVGTATTNFNGNTHTVTFKIPYTGAIGTLNTSSWTITGTGVTVTGIQNPIFVSYTAGQLSFTATVASTDVVSLAVGASQAQTYTVNMGTNGVTTVNGTRIKDTIAVGLSSSNLTKYIDANIGDWVSVSSNEYFGLRTSISMSNSMQAGANETIMTTTTNTTWGGAATFGNFVASGFTNISASNMPYAISFVPSTTQTTAIYQLKMSDFANVGYANIGSQIMTATTANTRQYFVLRGASARSITGSFVGYYASIAAIKGLTTGTVTFTTGNTSTVSSASTGTPSFQVLTSPTKVWA
jgi:alpha-tubulin suppressor-like RCC1 family protein